MLAHAFHICQVSLTPDSLFRPLVIATIFTQILPWETKTSHQQIFQKTKNVLSLIRQVRRFFFFLMPTFEFVYIMLPDWCLF